MGEEPVPPPDEVPQGVDREEDDEHGGVRDRLIEVQRQEDLEENPQGTGAGEEAADRRAHEGCQKGQEDAEQDRGYEHHHPQRACFCRVAGAAEFGVDH
eukprot:CAMPEP_0185787534 /NCGR_PEP_ID=MMETSP1174-20130828/141244_1 /TAXON_ID=35687 /ORGANISM="Dictyocha speculum, Strain CCMP1381" /LENGTH=98 /DNA_ID=CAMNT_0028480745 /DNA_START=160 /DNA_END=456 /DNA_ORIENTATION=+